MNSTQPHTNGDGIGGRLKRLAQDAVKTLTTMPIAEPETAPGGVLSSGVSGFASGANPETSAPKGSVGEFKPMSEYALSVAMKEATRGYGKKAGSGNKNIIYVDVDGWEGLAICRVSDREQWRPHDRLTGTFVRLTPDYLLEFAYLPGRRVGRGAR
jgi:hypothetical protein